jgi:hypothetical protein
LRVFGSIMLAADAMRWTIRSDEGAKIRMKAPTTKLQIPKKLQLPNSKLRRARLIQCLELGGLEFIWSLELGIWSFD